MRGVGVKLSLEEDKEKPRKNLDAVLDAPEAVAAASEFRNLPPRSVAHSADSRVLVVMQREYAVCKKVVDVVGSDDATSTVMLFVRLGDVVGCGHFDHDAAIGGENCGVRELADRVEKAALSEGVKQDTPLLVWIVGGFCDERKMSAHTLGLMLAALNALPDRTVDLQLVCSEKLNDVERGGEGLHFPVVLGAAFIRAENRVVPVAFTHLGPGVGLRSALPCTGQEKLTCCYDTDRDEICIEFEYREFDMVEGLLEAPDEFLRGNLASCPAQEPPRFVTTLRAGLDFLSKNPEWSETFANGPIRYRRSPIGAWVAVKK